MHLYEVLQKMFANRRKVPELAVVRKASTHPLLWISSEELGPDDTAYQDPGELEQVQQNERASKVVDAGHDSILHCLSLRDETCEDATKLGDESVFVRKMNDNQSFEVLYYVLGAYECQGLPEVSLSHAFQYLHEVSLD